MVGGGRESKLSLNASTSRITTFSNLRGLVISLVVFTTVIVLAIMSEYCQRGELSKFYNLLITIFQKNETLKYERHGALISRDGARCWRYLGTCSQVTGEDKRIVSENEVRGKIGILNRLTS